MPVAATSIVTAVVVSYRRTTITVVKNPPGGLSNHNKQEPCTLLPGIPLVSVDQVVECSRSPPASDEHGEEVQEERWRGGYGLYGGL